MVGALCLLLMLWCEPQNVPPVIPTPVMVAPVMAAPTTLAAPVMAVPVMAAPSLFDPACDVQPPDDIANDFHWAALRYIGASECELARQANAECTFARFEWCKTAVSSAGAIGVMQFLPATAKELNINPEVPAEAIRGAARYVQWCRARWTPGLAAGRTWILRRWVLVAIITALAICATIRNNIVGYFTWKLSHTCRMKHEIMLKKS